MLERMAAEMTKILSYIDQPGEVDVEGSTSTTPARRMPSTCGSRIPGGFRSPSDATAVARLRVKGASPVGKTNMDELGIGSSNEHSAFGPARNPWDPRWRPSPARLAASSMQNWRQSSPTS